MSTRTVRVAMVVASMVVAGSVAGCAQPGQLGHPLVAPPVAAPSTVLSVDVEPAPPPDLTVVGAPAAGAAPETVPGAAPAPQLDRTTSDQVLPPGSGSRWHSHPGVETVSVVAGEAVVRYPGHCSPRPTPAGLTVAVPAGVAHLVRNDSSRPVQLRITRSLDPAQPAQQDARAGC